MIVSLVVLSLIVVILSGLVLLIRNESKVGTVSLGTVMVK